MPDESKQRTQNQVGREIVVEMARRLSWTVLASLKLPLVLLFLIWELRAVGQTQILAANLAHGLSWVAPGWVLSMVLYRAFSQEGFAGTMLRWPRIVSEPLQRAMFRVVTIICPLLAMAETLKHYSGGEFSPSLGRFLLIAALAVMATVLRQAAHAVVQVEGRRSQQQPTLWLAGGHGLLWGVTVIPLLLVLLLATGYRFAAEQLSMALLWSLLAGMAVVLLWSFVTHSFDLFVSRLSSLIPGDDSSARQKRTDLQGHATQVSKLINLLGLVTSLLVGIQIWGGVLAGGPVLDQVRLWTGSPVGGETSWVTLRQGMEALLVIIITISLSRNLPGLIELLLPTRLPLDKGGRFAITFVARYIVALMGLMRGAQLVGFSWDRVQWLAAGLTVGLGFGLQEVFANLVSGIIILLERPVRVGDYVSVNNISGTVTRMALRATTLTDADRREWIIPNKKFITDDVMNWTLSDTISRAVFPISIAHGSDTKRAHQVLLEVARRQAAVLDHPEPSAVLVKIGNHSLDYELRVFLASRSTFSKLQNDLYEQLNQGLLEAGIEVTISTSERPILLQLTEGGDGRPSLPRHCETRVAEGDASEVNGDPDPAGGIPDERRGESRAA